MNLYKKYTAKQMIRLEIKNCNMILTEEQQKYQHYHLEKLINMNLTGEEILPSN